MHHIARTLPLTLLALTFACSDGGRPTPPPGPSTNRDAGTGPGPTSSCGNGAINGLEACDGTAFASGVSCDALGLRGGNLSCKNDCTIDTAGCGVRDYCTANDKYGNGECDPCDILGGQRDPDCDEVCGADGTCADRFDTLTNTWTCRRLGKTDPDCGECGNDVTDGNELCDGRAFAGGKITCSDYGFLGGDLACKSDCSPDFGACTFSVCGDGRKEGPELCDGTTFDGTTCESRGFAGGMLTCTSSCTVSDTSCVRPGCGNAILEPALEETCEGTNLDNQTCQTRGFAGGTLSCDGTCHFNESACIAMGCNNGIREASEQCEGSDLNGGTCENQGFLQGTLACSTMSCTYDTAGCIAPGCGNNIIEAGTEQCEGSNLNNATCAQQAGFAGGTLACDGSCRFDTSGCVAAGCGNGIIEAPTEQCEGANLNGGSCTSLGFVTGTVSCNGACRYDTSLCMGAGCGNGIREGSEQCDRGDFGGASCPQLGWTAGAISCDGMCRIDTSACTDSGDVCGDGLIQGNEPCDGTAFPGPIASRDCGLIGLGTGQFSCSNCRLGFAGCSTPDYCAVNMYYGDGACDYCQLGAGMRDSADCGTGAASRGGCGANAQCVEYYAAEIGNYTCQALYGQRDPDCGCGDGFLSPPEANGLMTEICEGTRSNVSMVCTDYGFAAGVVRCDGSCGLDFTNCR